MTKTYCMECKYFRRIEGYGSTEEVKQAITKQGE